MAGISKRRGKAAEKRVAAASGGELVPYSGAGTVKGDIHAGPVFIEVKSSATRAAGNVKSIGLQKAWLLKMQAQQAKEGKPLGVLVVHFSGDHKDWVCMAWDQWAELLEVWQHPHDY